ncbi:MAG: heavy metal sensor histidine kinase [Chthoniobacterales bacterium]
MFSRPTEPRSIASQLVLLFTPAAAFLLLCGLGLLYWIVVRHAFEEDNAVLLDKLASVRADVQESGGPIGLSSELRAPRSKERAAYLVRLSSGSGEVVAESPGMQRMLPMRVFPAPDDSNKTRPRNIRSGDRLFSVVSATATTNGQTFVIQVAQDRSEDERFSREFGLLTIAVLALGTTAAALIGATVTRRGLRPLREITSAAERIGPARLHERIASTPWPAELEPLATAFDAMLERLEDSFGRLSQFSADIAHELRTPLTNMLGEAQVALTKTRDADEYRAVIESTIAESERLAAIVDNLLFLARAEAGDRRVNSQQIDARAAAEKLANYYQSAAEDRRITLRCEGEGEIEADPMLFDRAVTNLLDNALRFTPDGGAITIAIRPDTAGTRITVSDNGPGIPADHLPRVFDRFYRVDQARNSGATGLGLSLVQSIAELHGGRAEIANASDGGTTVGIWFPSPKITTS